MSHEATIWAVKVRGISCTEARVLWHLADCHNPIYGCYPKQDYLATACEIDERSVRRSLTSLRDKGLVNWVEQREGKNRKANRYSLGFETGFRAAEKGDLPENEPDNLSASNDASTGQDCTFQPDSNDALNRTPESSIEPVREPVIEPVTERGSVREVSEDDPKSLRKRFQALIVGRHNNPWPDVLSSAPEWAYQQFVKLSPEERLRAEDRRDAYLAACPKLQSGEHKGQPRAAALGVYLRDRMFDLVDAIAPQAVSRQAEKRRQEESIPVAPFGPIWAGKRALALLDGPVHIDLPDNLLELAVETYNRLRRSSETVARSWASHRGITVDGNELVFPDDYRAQERRRRECDGGYPEAHTLDKLAKDRGRGAADPRFAILSDLCEAVPVGSETYDRWKAYHQQMNWPFVPDPGSMRVVYFPKGGPEGLREFEMAAQAALNLERGDDAE
ncbi:putative transcriptional regulator with a HTH domain [Rhizobium phage vB_RleM_PPF1]|uniref:helix-turn-helix domain-containing protein n=1 Tax=Rhizobium phage vB_RleM_PPF1 TaxID=1498228 RepID=UPI00049AEB10|nr:helix-turn-helix domain-containing protein [Rhizobium phage vB_RleM_PPF1]AID18403.1 putative transcriptional regulator with a HTH domain [Rhizobium phage vB_RleM_PPF1]